MKIKKKLHKNLLVGPVIIIITITFPYMYFCWLCGYFKCAVTLNII